MADGWLRGKGVSEGVEYISRGQCLVIGHAEAVQVAITEGDWDAEVKPTFVVVDNPSPPLAREAFERGYECRSGIPVKLEGHLGDFVLFLEREGSDEGWEQEKYALILDLLQPSMWAMEVKPFGYFAVEDEPAQIKSVVEGLKDWVGLFEKPKYFTYEEQLCVHGFGQIQGCRSCLDVCSTEAIVSKGSRIEVDPYLCQGCGDCTTGCPSGALSYTWPGREVTLARILEEMRRLPGREIDIRTESFNGVDGCDTTQLSLTVESIGSCGPEVWLAAIAYGATIVSLQREGLTKRSVCNLQHQMSWVNELLAGMGYGSGRIHWTHGAKEQAQPVTDCNIPAAGFAPFSDKRDVLNMALGHLGKYAPNQAKSVIDLPTGSPIGGLAINLEKCTLCMSCVNVCPASALHAGQELPQLRIIEMNCVQCGLCEQACPEGAVTLQPRWLADREKASSLQVLHEEPAFECVECGQPFATQKMIDTILARVSGNPLFNEERQRRRLMMCENCRIRDMIREEN